MLKLNNRELADTITDAIEQAMRRATRVLTQRRNFESTCKSLSICPPVQFDDIPGMTPKERLEQLRGMLVLTEDFSRNLGVSAEFMRLTPSLDELLTSYRAGLDQTFDRDQVTMNSHLADFYTPTPSGA